MVAATFSSTGSFVKGVIRVASDGTFETIHTPPDPVAETIEQVKAWLKSLNEVWVMYDKPCQWLADQLDAGAWRTPLENAGACRPEGSDQDCRYCGGS